MGQSRAVSSPSSTARTVPSRSTSPKPPNLGWRSQRLVRGSTPARCGTYRLPARLGASAKTDLRLTADPALPGSTPASSPQTARRRPPDFGTSAAPGIDFVTTACSSRRPRRRIDGFNGTVEEPIPARRRPARRHRCRCSKSRRLGLLSPSGSSLGAPSCTRRRSRVCSGRTRRSSRAALFRVRRQPTPTLEATTHHRRTSTLTATDARRPRSSASAVRTTPPPLACAVATTTASTVPGIPER